jgi:hypothetical protein
MTKRPILLNGPMVRAILEGRKTMTRRVMKLRRNWVVKGITIDDLVLSGFWNAARTDGTMQWQYGDELLTPNYQVGDRLWVRETWGIDPFATDNGHQQVLYRAGPPTIDPDYPVKWRPSIHMPRWASRITLEITGIRVERVRDISKEDAKAEGIIGLEKWLAGGPECPDSGFELAMVQNPQFAFQVLWDLLNAKRGYSWELNPFVWAISFRRIDA